MSVNGIEVEVGQFWYTHSHEVVSILSNDKHAYYPFVASNGLSYCSAGTSYGAGADDRLEYLADSNIRAATPCTIFDPQPIDMHTTGYHTLANVLQMAYYQAARGKGVERHAAVGEPFHHQVMQVGAAKFGIGALLFQAFKKSEESQRLEHDRAVNELLGAINYLAGAVIALELARGDK